MERLKRKNIGIRCAMMLMFLGVAMPRPATAQLPSGRLQIANHRSNLCLSPAGGGRAVRDPIVQYTCDSNPSRMWSFTVVSPLVVEIVNLDSGLCLATDWSLGLNAQVQQVACSADPSVRWVFIQGTPGSERFQLRNVYSGLCMTVAGGASGPNIVAVQYLCDGDPSRLWRILP